MIPKPVLPVSPTTTNSLLPNNSKVLLLTALVQQLKLQQSPLPRQQEEVNEKNNADQQL